MGIRDIFERQSMLFEGRDQQRFLGYQEILRSSGIRFKAYAVEDRIAGGCCGLNSASPAGARPPRFTYSLFVPARELERARELVTDFQPTP